MSRAVVSPAPIRREQLCGAWRLEHFEVRPPEGAAPRYPFGMDARGRLLYTPEGWMSAFLARADAPALGPGTLERAHQASDEAKARAWDATLAYTARWRLEGHEVVHAVEMSTVPDAVGREQRRRAHLEGDRLWLAYEAGTRAGPVAHYALRWIREGS